MYTTMTSLKEFWNKVFRIIGGNPICMHYGKFDSLLCVCVCWGGGEVPLCLAELKVGERKNEEWERSKIAGNSCKHFGLLCVIKTQTTNVAYGTREHSFKRK